MEISKKEAKEYLTKLEKMGVNLDKLEFDRLNPNIDSIKLQTLNQVIGNLVTDNGVDDVRVQVLSEIARDLKKRLKK